MRAEQALIIYEIRALDQKAFKIFDSEDKLNALGPTLAGVHWEADFAFIFFKAEPGSLIDTFLQKHPELELRHIHNMTYAQWQDGADAPAFEVSGLHFANPNTQAPEPKLLIDPGLAFGFGGHPTTYSCLNFLSRVCQAKSGPPQTALDLGAGTGILSLAAAFWGVKKVIGVDYSHLAIDAALNNLSLNQMSEKVSFYRAPAQQFANEKADLLLANLHLSLQEELFNLGAFNERKSIIISGLLPSEGEQLLEDFKKTGLKLLDQHRSDRWITMLLISAK